MRSSSSPARARRFARYSAPGFMVLAIALAAAAFADGPSGFRGSPESAHIARAPREGAVSATHAAQVQRPAAASNGRELASTSNAPAPATEEAVTDSGGQTAPQPAVEFVGRAHGALVHTLQFVMRSLGEFVALPALSPRLWTTSLRSRFAATPGAGSELEGAQGTDPNADTTRVSKESLSRASLVQLGIDINSVDRSSTAYTRFKSWVDNAVNGSPGYDFHAADAAIMFLITRDTRYCTTGVTLVEAQVVAAEAAIAGGRNPEVAGDSYLEVGPMIADLAYVYQACNAQMTASQRQRWGAYAEQAIWNVWNYQSARWGTRSAPWSGWSVTNPGNNYHYSFIEATMTWALASGSRTWFDFLNNNKLPAMQAYYASVPGGGSLEGTGYGTAQKRLLDLYYLWRASTGQDLSLTNTHARNTVPYWLHATVPTRDRFAPIGDQSRNSVPELYDYHRHLMLSARSLSYDPEIRDMASWWLRNISVAQMGQGANLRYDALLPAGTAANPPAQLHYAAAGTGHVFARTGWDTAAMWMAFVAGPFNESHAHQDQGSFTLFSRGNWLAVTENIWSHSGINQGTEFHNVVRFERGNTSAQQCAAPANDVIVHQCEPSTSTATVTPGENGALTITANLTPAYRGNPALGGWNRRIDFAARRLRVLDTFTLGSGTTAWFQVNTPVQPTIVDARTVDAGGLRVRVLQPASPTIRLVNWTGSGFSQGWRIDIGGASTTYEVELVER